MVGVMGAARMLLLLLWLGLISRISGQESELSERCGEEEYNDTRAKYEACASNKIREITDRLATDKDSVCVAVQQLIHNCGDELGWCFTEEQVAETKRKQKAGLEGILSERYEGSSLDECFNRAMPVISSLVTSKPTAKHVVPTEVTTTTAHLVSTGNIVKTTSASSSLISSTPELQTTRPATETTRPATETTRSATETTRPATETHRQTTPITTAKSATDSYDSHKDSETGGPQETTVSQTITPQKSQEIQTNSPKQTTEQIKTQTQTTKLPQKVSSVENKSHNYPTKNVSILLSTSNVRAKVAQEASKFPNNIPKEASDIRTNIPQEASEIRTNIPQDALETRTNVLKPSSVPVRQPRQNVAPSPNNNAIISRCPEIINALLVIYIYLFIA